MKHQGQNPSSDNHPSNSRVHLKFTVEGLNFPLVHEFFIHTVLQNPPAIILNYYLSGIYTIHVQLVHNIAHIYHIKQGCL